MPKLHLIPTILLCTMYYLLSTAPAHAQSVGLSITPPTVELLLAPNKRFVQAFSLTNQGQSSDFVVNLHNVAPSDSEGHVTVSPAALSLDKLTLVVTLDTSDLHFNTPFHLDSGSTKQLVLAIEGASTDVSVDTYLGLVASAVPPTSTSSSATTTPGVASLILVTLTPDGTLPVSLEVADFDPPSLHDSMDPLSLSPSLSNKGPVMLRSSGELVITSSSGNEVYHETLYNNLILKGSNRLIMGSTQSGEPAPLTWQPHWYDLGLYNIRLTITTTGGRTIQEVERSVWIAPLRLITILVIALILIILLIILKWRRQLKRAAMH